MKIDGRVVERGDALIEKDKIDCKGKEKYLNETVEYLADSSHDDTCFIGQMEDGRIYDDFVKECFTFFYD